MARSIGAQIAHYAGGQILLQLASVVSFPTFTRVLTQAQYGMMSMVNTALPMFTPFAKWGMSNATERFYAEHKARGQEQEFFATTRIFSMLWGAGMVLAMEVALGLLLLLVPEGLVPARSATRRLASLLMLVGPLLFVRSQLAVLLQVVRARQETLYYNAVTAVDAYASLGLSLLLLFTMGMRLEALFVGQTLGSALVFGAVTLHLTRKLPLRLSLYRKAMVREALEFGTPLMWNEVSGIIGQFVDRFVLFWLLSEEAVAVYSSGVNVAVMLATLVAAPLGGAVLPIAFQRWADGGATAVRKLLEPVGRWTLRLALPLLAGAEAVAAPLVLTMASDKYAAAVDIMRLNFLGVLLWRLSGPLTIAILIAKRTRLQRNVVWAATAANLGLALVLVPHLGVHGAAIAYVATTVSACVYLAVVAYRILPLRIYGAYLVPSAIAAIVMYASIFRIDAGRPWATLLCRAVVGLVVYAVVLLTLDREARHQGREGLRILRTLPSRLFQ